MADEAVPCKYCNEAFKTQAEWKEHVSTDHDVTGYPCDLCTQVFYKEHDYIQHFNAEHKSDFNRHICSHCGVSYKWFKFLEQHIQKKHQIETMKQCDHCGEEFYNSVAFRSHLKLKHAPGKKFHKCKKCHRSFTAKSFLQMHDKFDHSKRGSKLFKEYVLDNLNLDSESLLDSTKKCSKCDLQFSSFVYLFKHFKLAHNRKKYYQCCVCNEAVYNTRAGLSIHLHYEHGISREHKCVKCMTGHLTPPKTDKKTKAETSATKEVLSQNTLPPWSDMFKSKGIPDDLDLVDANDVEISNLRSNIRNLFHLLATVTPSKLKNALKTDAKTDTFFTMKNFKSDEVSKDGRRRYEIEPKTLKFEKNSYKSDRTTRQSILFAEETDKVRDANAKEAVSVAEETEKELDTNLKEAVSVAEETEKELDTNLKEAVSVAEETEKELDTNLKEVVSVAEETEKEPDANLKEAVSVAGKMEQEIGSNLKEAVSVVEEMEQEPDASLKEAVSVVEEMEQEPDARLKEAVSVVEETEQEPDANLKEAVSVVEVTEKEPNANAKETNAISVKQKSSKAKLQFQCHKCKDRFTYRKALNMHKVRVHGFKGFPNSTRKSDQNHDMLSRKCEAIERENITKNAIKPTKDNETISTPNYKCNTCNVEFSEQVLLLNHLTEKHTTGPNHQVNVEANVVFKCPDCYVGFKTENELSAHMNGHTKQDENAKKVCEVCKKHFKKAKTMYKCLKCNKRFAKRSVLHRHIRKQHKMPIFKCTKCNAFYKVAEKLEQHTKLKHNNSDAVALPVLKIQKSKLSPIKLDKLPNILSNILTRNLLNGTLHNCKICNSYFPSNELLQRHIQWEHTKNVNLHKCGQCNQVLYSVEDLELHMSATHSNEGPKKWKKQIAFNYEHQTDI